MFTDSDWANTWATTTVGNTEGFMQIQVRDIAAKFTRLADTNHGIEIGAIDIYLTAMIVNNATDLCDLLFEHTVG